MDNLVRMFISSVNQLLKGQVEELTQCIRGTITWQRQVHEEMQERSRGLSEAVFDVRDTLAQTADLVQDLSTEGQQLKRIIADLGAVSGEVYDILNQAVDYLRRCGQSLDRVERALSEVKDRLPRR